MHFRLLVTFNKKDAKNSQEARNHVFNFLGDDPSFVGEGGMFSTPIADWFVIGGRWSGKLSEKTWAKEVIKKIEAMEKKEDIQIAGCDYGDKEKTKKQEELRTIVEKMYQEAMPKELKGKGLVYDRFLNQGTYNQNGFYDDAIIIDETFYNLFLKKYKGERKDDGDGDLNFVDLDENEVSKKFIGSKWLVVIDYHN